MVSIELLRRYPFFAGFTHKQFAHLARVAKEEYHLSGHQFFSEGEFLTSFFLVCEGTVGIILKVPDRASEQSLTRQITNHLITRDVTVSVVGEGDLFGWSAIIPPNLTTATAKAINSCRVIRFDYQKLKPAINEDCCFGHQLTLKAAQIIRERLRNLHVESLAESAI